MNRRSQKYKLHEDILPGFFVSLTCHSQSKALKSLDELSALAIEFGKALIKEQSTLEAFDSNCWFSGRIKVRLWVDIVN